MQESVPERLDLKRRVLGRDRRCMPAGRADRLLDLRPSALGTSSGACAIRSGCSSPIPTIRSTSCPWSRSSAARRRPRRRSTAPAPFLTPIGMKGVVIAREIEAFVGDRLLEALWREALWLIKDDICDVETLDDVIRYSFGLRWAQMGLFQTYRIAGGEAGMRHFLAQFGPCLKWPWTKLTDVVDLDERSDREDRHAVGQAGGGPVDPRAGADPRREPRRHPAIAEGRPQRRRLGSRKVACGVRGATSRQRAAAGHSGLRAQLLWLFVVGTRGHPAMLCAVSGGERRSNTSELKLQSIFSRTLARSPVRQGIPRSAMTAMGPGCVKTLVGLIADGFGRGS